MHCILVWHTYVGILLQLFSLMGEMDKVKPIYTPYTSLGKGYTESIKV